MVYPPVEVLTWTIGFFDGASNHEHCGYGIVLVLNKDHYFYIYLGGGLGTNTKA